MIAAIFFFTALSSLCIPVTSAGSAGGRFNNPLLVPLPWGLIPYGGETQLPNGTRNALDESDTFRASSSANDEAELKTVSSIFGSASAGGASAADALQSTLAFVGSSATCSSTATATRRGSSPPCGAMESPTKAESRLSVAKNHRLEVDATASEDSPSVSSLGELAGERNKGPLKILFLSSDTGGGHRASAEALAAQFQKLYPGTTYDLIDIWTDVDCSWPYSAIKDTYKSFSATPWKWRTLYHVSNTRMNAKLTDLHSWYMNEEKIRAKLEEYDADVVVSVHPTMNYVPLLAIRTISEKRGRDIPFFTVVTDFGSGHCTWFNKDVDRIYLASDSIKKIAQHENGVPDEKIVMSGLPIRYDFASQADTMGDRTTPEGKKYQEEMRERLNINPKKRMLLLMGGGEGVGSLSDIVNELYAKLRAQGVDATICVVCGRNDELKNDLETRCWDTVLSESHEPYRSMTSIALSKLVKHASRSRRIQMALDRAAAKAAKGRDIASTPGNIDVVPLGFVTNMAEYMVAADVLVSKAGPGTLAEAAAVGLPVMVTSYLPGQEAGNVDIVLNGGFGDFCEDPESIASELACWLQDSQLLNVMSQKALEVGHPHAAEEIALDIGDTTHQWIAKETI